MKFFDGYKNPTNGDDKLYGAGLLTGGESCNDERINLPVALALMVCFGFSGLHRAYAGAMSGAIRMMLAFSAFCAVGSLLALWCFVAGNPVYHPVGMVLSLQFCLLSACLAGMWLADLRRLLRHLGAMPAAQVKLHNGIT